MSTYENPSQVAAWDSAPENQGTAWDSVPVAALFVRKDSIYKTMAGVDAYDAERDALTYGGTDPVIAHPPCRGWGRLRQFSHATDGEKLLAIHAYNIVQAVGGVLEHPAESSLWARLALPRPGRQQILCGRSAIGYTIEVDQWVWGHRAEKRTWLYIVGCHPDNLPAIPVREGKPTHCVRPTRTYPRLPSITKSEREKTPAAFAEWLVQVARRCSARAKEVSK